MLSPLSSDRNSATPTSSKLRRYDLELFNLNLGIGKHDMVWKVFCGQPIPIPRSYPAISGFKGSPFTQYPVYTIRNTTGKAYYRKSTALDCCNGSTAYSFGSMLQGNPNGDKDPGFGANVDAAEMVFIAGSLR